MEGRVTAITADGRLLSDITAEQLAHAPRDDRVTVICGDHETVGIFSSEHQEPESTLLALIGPSGRLEIMLVGMNISEMLGIQVGERVVVKW
jgi:S-adenosylmethionine hydrolase